MMPFFIPPVCPPIVRFDVVERFLIVIELLALFEISADWNKS
jgi:hypothetical protein